MASFIPCVLTFLLAVNAAYGLKCYKCNSKDNMACKWGATKFTYEVEECEKALTDILVNPKCFKISAEDKDGKELIGRGCLKSKLSTCDTIAKSIGWISSSFSNDLRNVDCDTCEFDKCNSAQRITGVTFIGLILAATIFVF